MSEPSTSVKGSSDRIAANVGIPASSKKDLAEAQSLHAESFRVSDPMVDAGSAGQTHDLPQQFMVAPLKESFSLAVRNTFVIQDSPGMTLASFLQ